MVENEEWRPVPMPEFSDYYEVSSLGRVRSLPRKGGWRPVPGRILKPGQHGKGYQNITFSVNGVRGQRLVHQLVLEAFVGPPEVGQEVRHKNGKRDDNRLENLVWGTSSENEYDKLQTGTMQHGSRNGQAKLSEEQVQEIRQKYADGGVSQRTLAAAYGLSQGQVSRLITGTRWSHLTGS